MELFDKNTASQLQRIQRVWDIEDCKKLMYKFSFSMANGNPGDTLETLWVQKEENRRTASYGRNWGFFYGYDEVARCLKDIMKAPEKGYMSFTNYATFAIQIARDGKTAYSVWAANPVDTFVQDGKTVGWKSSEKIWCNFILEDDEWKIWKLFIGTEMSIRVGDSIADYPCDLEPDAVPLPREPQFETATIKCEAFTNQLNSWEFPPLPREYDTYDPSLSCGPDGHPTAKEAI